MSSGHRCWLLKHSQADGIAVPRPNNESGQNAVIGVAGPMVRSSEIAKMMSCGAGNYSDRYRTYYASMVWRASGSEADVESRLHST